MAANDNETAQAALWYFIGATFIAALPMIMFPNQPWWARGGTLLLALALIAGGGWRQRREKHDESSQTDEPPQL